MRWESRTRVYRKELHLRLCFNSHTHKHSVLPQLHLNIANAGVQTDRLCTSMKEEKKERNRWRGHLSFLWLNWRWYMKKCTNCCHREYTKHKQRLSISNFFFSHFIFMTIKFHFVKTQNTYDGWRWIGKKKETEQKSSAIII